MQIIDCKYLIDCILKLDEWNKNLATINDNEPIYEVYRSAIIKEFQIIIDQSRKLLEKKLKQKNYISDQELREFSYVEVFKKANEKGLIDEDLTKRWTKKYYRQMRNNLEHQYGIHNAQKAIEIMSDFVFDAKKLVKIIND